MVERASVKVGLEGELDELELLGFGGSDEGPGKGVRVRVGVGADMVLRVQDERGGFL